MSELDVSRSPRWSPTTKLIVGLTLVALFAGLFIQFRDILGPLLISYILSYLIHPMANFLRRKAHLSWRMAVNLLYLVLIIILIGLLTWGGVTIISQIQSLVDFLDKAIEDLPKFLSDIRTHPIQIGPFILDPMEIDLQTIVDQILGAIEPMFTQVGSLAGSIASGTAALVGWLLFILFFSYFILSETGGRADELLNLSIPGYDQDLRKVGHQLGAIWNGFLRGQFLIVSLTVMVYIVLLGVLGVRYYFGLAILAGLARFVPYAGPAISWATYATVAYFQGNTLFGMSPFSYALLVVLVAWVTDGILDNYFIPRMMADALQVHPAAVMVAVLIGANLMGLIGIVLAAPVLATVKLFFDYAMYKMTDQDPWTNLKTIPPPRPLSDDWAALRTRLQSVRQRLLRLMGGGRDDSNIP